MGACPLPPKEMKGKKKGPTTTGLHDDNQMLISEYAKQYQLITETLVTTVANLPFPFFKLIKIFRNFL